MNQNPFGQNNNQKPSPFGLNTNPFSQNQAAAGFGQPQQNTTQNSFFSNANTGAPQNSFFSNANTGVPQNSSFSNINTGTPQNSFFSNANTSVPPNSFSNPNTGALQNNSFSGINTGAPQNSFSSTPLANSSSMPSIGGPQQNASSQPPNISPFSQSPGAFSSFNQGNATAQPSSNITFGQQNTNPFSQPPSTNFGTPQNSASPFGQPAANQQSLNQPQANVANSPSSTNPLTGIVEENTSHLKDTVSDSHSSLVDAIRENTTDLYNSSLQTILDHFSLVLDANIREFNKDAKKVFDTDSILVESLNNYVMIKDKIAEENRKLDELSEALDFFEKKLGDAEVGSKSEMGVAISNFEAITDKYYRTIESFKDDQDEVLDLVNEIYEIIDYSDKKIDSLKSFANMPVNLN